MSDERSLILLDDQPIEHLICTVRGKQVMIDRDLARLYQVQTKVFNQAVKRNIERFPPSFRFQLTEDEFTNLRSQFVTSSLKSEHGGRRYLPYAFTEQGIAMLSAVLRSDIAVEVSIKIMNAFVEMRRFMLSNASVFERLTQLEIKQLETDEKLGQIFSCLGNKTMVKQHIFFQGQIYDAFSLIVDLIQSANHQLVLIDNYVDITSLNLLCKKRSGVDLLIVTAGKASLTAKDIAVFNTQYPRLSVKISHDFHDRFLILDQKQLYHIGASLKDAGKKTFAMTKIEDQSILQSLLHKVY